MGRATRWLKDLFGFKRDRPKHETEYSEKKSRCRSGPLVAAINIIPPNITPAEAAWLTSFYNEPDDQQKQHARAVAAATAAAADAALATARAAAKVVRLTTQGRSIREKIAAAKIQTVFRGYLARKALRALKALVKIQSLVRGFLVRKQAAATLQRMHALIRSQEIVRALKAGPQFQARKSSLVSRRLSSSATNDENSKIVEVDIGCWPKSDDLWISQSGYYPESCMSSCVTESTLKTRRQRSQSAPRPRRPEPPLPIRMKAHNLNKSRV